MLTCGRTHLDDNTFWCLCVVDLLLYLLKLIPGTVAGTIATLDTIFGKGCDGHCSRFCGRKRIGTLDHQEYNFEKNI